MIARRRSVRASGPAIGAPLAALVLAPSSPPAGRGADAPPPGPAPAFFSAAHPDHLLLVRVYANAARDDEFVEIGNPRPEPVDMSGWSITDGEATATFPLDSILSGGGRLLVARNATSYAEDTLRAADFAFEAGAARRMEGQVPRLADAGDEVLLRDPNGTLVDVYAWGSSSYDGLGWVGRPAERMGRGEIAVRRSDAREAWIDTDAAAGWEDLRHERLGQSAFFPTAMTLHGPTTAVLSPDEGDAPLIRFLSSAQSTIEVAVFTFTSERVASVLAAAADRGVHVRVLLDGAPVGGIETAEHRVVGGLLIAGVEVRWLAGGPGHRQPRPPSPRSCRPLP